MLAVTNNAAPGVVGGVVGEMMQLLILSRQRRSCFADVRSNGEDR